MTLNEPQRNPFPHMGQWYWRDQDDLTRGPYTSQMDALRDLTRSFDPRSWWQKFLDTFR